MAIGYLSLPGSAEMASVPQSYENEYVYLAHGYLKVRPANKFCQLGASQCQM